MYQTYNVSYTAHFIKDCIPAIDANSKRGISRTAMNEMIKQALEREPDILMMQIEKVNHEDG